MSETKLLPCPFCGGNASLLEKADEFGNYSVMCTRARCMAEGSPCYSVEAAIAEWNHRDLTPKQEAAEDLFEALSYVVPEGDDWWCPTCREALSGSRVTNSECCDTCGTYLGGVASSEWLQRARAALAKAGRA